MTIFQVFFGFLARFRLVFDFFGGYVDPGAESPGQPLFRLFSEFSSEKAFDSCTISQGTTSLLLGAILGANFGNFVSDLARLFSET